MDTRSSVDATSPSRGADEAWSATSRKMTLPEILLWDQIKAGRLGVKFRRQVPIGQYVVDFLCHERRLIVEVDGSQHTDGADESPDRWLADRGYRVLRIWNSIVLEDVEEAVIMIRNRM